MTMSQVIESNEEQISEEKTVKMLE